jgi:hypothetical protein
MAQRKFTTVVGIFETHARAQQAVADLKAAGFTDDQISMAARDQMSHPSGHVIGDDFAGEGAATGLAAGAGLGALWGLGIVAGVMPVIGPALAAGSLAAILSSAAAGAAVAGLAGALVGMGIPKEEAEYYQREFETGRVVIAVAAQGREPEARLIIQRNGGYDQASRGNLGRTTLDVPVERDELEREREVRTPLNPPPMM